MASNNFKKHKNQIILIILDAILVIGCAFFSIYMRFEFNSVPAEYFSRLLFFLPIDVVLTIITFWCFRLYHSVWTFVSVNEVVKITVAVALVTLAEITYKSIALMPMPRSVYFIDFAILCFLVIGLRLSIRFRHKQLPRLMNSEKPKRIMIIGAGNAGSILIQDLVNEGKNNKVCCAIDDNPTKNGKYIQGVKILGGREKIGYGVERYQIDEIIIALPSLKASELRELIEMCNKTNITTKILPSISKTLDSSLSKEVREINYEDLLGRDAVNVNQDGIHNFIEDKVILVTGGGGSIGSELCRQIICNKPSKLIIFDIYENCAYDIQNQLKREYPEINVHTLIGSVRDIDRLESVFKEYAPDVIYHAAAHKHVPLMEESPNEAIKNNCLGTQNMAILADKYKVDNFILISTDKAVRPTNIMGASKRVCEMIIQSYAKKSKHTRFAAVRFGNVLGSNGSVIPLFLKQIESGGPVTVTHPEVTRYFMTIPEAVSLVLQASLYAKGGEIFVLDMGNPVKIYELAENLIRLKGYEPTTDIDIEIVGLRPGEKLYEELLMEEEGLEKTENQMIFIGRPIELNMKTFIKKLEKLIGAAKNNDKRIKELTEDICNTYTKDEK